MGKSGSTNQDNVRKRPTVYTESKAELEAGVGGQTGNGAEKTRQINECMVRFDMTVEDGTHSLQLGDVVILVPEGVGGVQVLEKGRKVATYVGDLTGKLFECMKLGYTYRGEVTDVIDGTSQVTIRVIARGKV